VVTLTVVAMIIDKTGRPIVVDMLVDATGKRVVPQTKHVPFMHTESESAHEHVV